MSNINSKIKKIPVEKFFSIRTIGGFSISNDDKYIYYITNTTGLPQIWKVSTFSGCPEQISVWGDAIKSVLHNPVKSELLFLSDKKGDENYRIFRLKTKEGEIEHLTGEFEDSQSFFSVYNKKGTKFLFATNKRLKYNFDVYIKDLKTGKNELVRSFEDEFPVESESWSSNERYITFIVHYGNISQDILLLDRKSGVMENVTKNNPGDDIFNAYTKFNRKCTGFYYLSDEGRNFKGIKFYDIKSRKSEWFLTENWDITNFEFSRNFNRLIYTVNENGSNNVKLKNLGTGKVRKLKLPKGNYSSFDFTKDSKRLVYICDSPLNPADIFTYDFRSEKINQRTFSVTGGVTKDSFTKPVDVFYKSFDGLKIHALLFVPKGLKKDGRNPAILWPHGGPEWQEIHNFNKYVQVMANAGFIVLAPNFRGSTGYGKDFQKLIYKDWGGGEFQDVLYGVECLKKSGYVDKNKIGIAGGSFGGFMVLTCITKAPEIWKCAVDIFGPSNLFTFLRSVPEHWKNSTDSLVGNPDKDIELLKERSPINFVDNIKCPLLVIQGRQDPRVVQAESEQIVSKLRNMGKHVDYILLEDEGHGFSKVSNQIRVFKEKIKFLENYLR
ncbi:MAG: S9 family peptidase [Ignavibacteriae bacterium]|nr:S9 family peptidase [Ignavibacteriota bacterium]